jgi:type II secretory pathway pseudopilin PulG
MNSPANRDRESGLGLIELIVAIVVTGLVMAAIATVLVNSWRTQEQVVSVTEATNRGQLVGSAIERAMRNALYFEVESNDVLLVRTSLTGAQECQGFRLSAGTSPDFGNAQMDMAEKPASGVALPSDRSTWPEWQSGVAQQGTTNYFTKTGDGTLKYAFQIETDAAPVAFASSIAPRSIQESVIGSDGCW